MFQQRLQGQVSWHVIDTFPVFEPQFKVSTPVETAMNSNECSINSKKSMHLIFICVKNINPCLGILVCVLSVRSDPMDYSPPGSSVHGIFQARTLEQVAISSSRGSSQPRNETCVSCISCIGSRTLYHWCHLGSPLPGTYQP